MRIAHVLTVFRCDRKVKMFAIAWDQTSEVIRRKVEASPNYETIKADDDLVGLLSAIKTIAFNFETRKRVPILVGSFTEASARKSIYLPRLNS